MKKAYEEIEKGVESREIELKPREIELIVQSLKTTIKTLKDFQTPIINGVIEELDFLLDMFENCPNTAIDKDEGFYKIVYSLKRLYLK